jgi:hypothetical protein
MLAIYNLWSRYLPGDGTCKFDVTMANAPRIKDGSLEFINACLGAFQVHNSPRDWRIRPFRSSFYSDYIGANEAWEDRWVDGWAVDVALDGSNREADNRLSEFPVNVSVIDRTWDGMSKDQQHDSTALFIAVFRGDERMTKEAGRKILDRARYSEVSGTQHLSVRSFGPRQQLRIWFCDVAFPSLLRIGDELIVLARQMGGIVNRRDLELLDR